MRYKFRAWIKSLNRMENTIDFSPFHVGDCDRFRWKHEEVELMQFTGLTDKNGKDIYEGDIVKREFEIYERNWEGSVEYGDLAYTEEIADSGHFIGVVKLRPSEGYVLNKCRKFDDEGNFLLKRSGVKLHAQYAEVIGNIYENPELLES